MPGRAPGDGILGWVSVHSGPFVVFAEEVHEESADLLYMPEATASDWATVFNHAEVRRIGAGLAVVQAGEEDRALYLLTEGTIGVRLPRDESAFKTVDAPSVLGELAFFDGRPRSATLAAVTDVEVVRLDADAFASLSAEAPELGHAMLLDLARILALRLRMASQVIAQLRGV
jgi:CRP/FNR family transcriptional regulator, cyclic AMP receptor protein